MRVVMQLRELRDRPWTEDVIIHIKSSILPLGKCSTF